MGERKTEGKGKELEWIIHIFIYNVLVIFTNYHKD